MRILYRKKRICSDSRDPREEGIVPVMLWEGRENGEMERWREREREREREN